MGVCAGITRKGARCTASVPPGAEWCYNHDPERQAERRRNAARGGKAKAGGELAQAKSEIRAVISGVLSGRVERRVGAVVLQGYNTLLKAVSVELKAREQLELIERLEALEEALESNRSRERRYGA